MFDMPARKTLLALVTGAVLAAGSASALAQDKDEKTYKLLDAQGQPVMDASKKCVMTPQTENNPAKLFEECGDIFCSKDKDADGDGINDCDDECQGTPAGTKVNAKGCTLNCAELDSDNDGINDCDDKCPGTPAGIQVGSDGCGIAGVEEVVTLSGDVNFAFDKADLTAAGKATLDNLAAQILAKQDRITGISVVGHTDSIGTDAYNQGLSERRATTVLKYLTAKGVAASMISSRGEGEKNPIASNKTKDGRAQNRRVEIRIGNYATK